MKNLLLRGALVICCLVGLSQTAFTQVDLYLDSINVYINSYGKIQIYSLPDTILQLTRMSSLVGTASGKVFDYEEDLDTEVAPELITNPSFGDYEIFGSFNNNYSGLPPNVLVKENIYCWRHQNVVLVKYTVINRETSPMNAVYGLEVIPELEGAYAGTDTVTYNSQTQIFSDRKTEALGFKLLSGNVNSLNAFMYYSNYNTDANFWNWLTNGTIITQVVIDPTTPNVDDPVIIPSFNSKTIAVGDSAIYYVGIGYGLNKSKMLYNMQLVQQNYNILNPTPVELTSFNGLFSNNTVKLSWETATETNNRGFDIERCEGNNWSTLSFITGKGTTIEPSKYFYSDVPDKSGTYKYRLKQIDFDGKVNYSKEITVEFNRNINSYALSQNYPNPFNPTTSFSYQIPVAGFVSLKVFDVLGKEVATLVNENKVQGSYEVNFDAKKLTSGVYIYQLRINNNIISKKMNLLK